MFPPAGSRKRGGRMGTAPDTTGPASTQVAADSPKEQVFLRKASGLVRQVSATDSFLFNSGGLNWGFGLAFVGAFVLAFYPGANLSLAILIPLIFCICQALCYLFFTVIMPRSGETCIICCRRSTPRSLP